MLTFNIHGGLRNDRLHLDAIARTIRTSRADVVLLQEVDRLRLRSRVVDQAAWLGRTLDMDVAYGANKLRPPAADGLPQAAIGNAILSRFPLSDAANTHLPNRPGMELRGLLHAQVSVDGMPVSIYTTHLQHTSGSMRIEQAHAIRRVVDLDPLPKILGGDLNAEPDSVSLRVLERGALTDTWREVGAGEGLDRAGPGSAPTDRLPAARGADPAVGGRHHVVRDLRPSTAVGALRGLAGRDLLIRPPDGVPYGDGGESHARSQAAGEVGRLRPPAR